MTTQRYKRIAGWDVSLELPDSVREILKIDFDSWEKGEVPDGQAAHSFRSYFERNGSVSAYTFKVIELLGLSELEDKLRDGTLSPHERFALTKRLCVARSDPTHDKSSAEHIQGGSTPQCLAPDPFIVIDSYLSGGRIDDYEKLRDRASKRKNGAAILWTVPPKEYCLSPDQNQYFADGKNPMVSVLVSIDVPKRNAVINPHT